MKVYRVELMVLDHDGLGIHGVRDTLENTRYPNHCIGPSVMQIEGRDVEWSDEHPLNHTSKQEAAFRELFK